MCLRCLVVVGCGAIMWLGCWGRCSGNFLVVPSPVRRIRGVVFPHVGSAGGGELCVRATSGWGVMGSTRGVGVRRDRSKWVCTVMVEGDEQDGGRALVWLMGWGRGHPSPGWGIGLEWVW